MKQIKNILLLATTAVVLFTACKKSSDSSSTSASIVGTWTYNTASEKYTGQSYSYDTTATLSGKSTITFTSSGSYTITANSADDFFVSTYDNGTESGTYSVNSAHTQLYMTNSYGDNDTATIKTLTSNSLVLYTSFSAPLESDETTYTLSR